MNLVFALLILLGTPKEPQVYYYNGRILSQLKTLEFPNVRNAAVQFFVYSPYELREASVDSTEIPMCLPDHKLTEELKLRGRWYRLIWVTNLTVGSTQHTLYLTSYWGKIHKKNFTVNVEGNKRIDKPQGVNR